MENKKLIKRLKNSQRVTRFVKTHYRRYEIKIKNEETELIDFINNKENKQQYIINLIKKDMENNK